MNKISDFYIKKEQQILLACTFFSLYFRLIYKKSSRSSRLLLHKFNHTSFFSFPHFHIHQIDNFLHPFLIVFLLEFRPHLLYRIGAGHDP